jgi:hypothetical protein
MSSLKRQFQCFDALPSKLRAVLANSAFDWDATLFSEAIELGASPDALLSRVLEDEQRRIPIDNYIMYGPDHPGSARTVQLNWLKYYKYPLQGSYWWRRT